MPASGVETVGAVRECYCNAESDNPRRHSEELSLYRGVPKTCHNGGGVESERALRHHVGHLCEVRYAYPEQATQQRLTYAR